MPLILERSSLGAGPQNVYSNSRMIRVLGTGFAALLGLAFGSFLNVCLSRWPEGESIVHPRSHCRQCAHSLTWWENIPLLSWIALRGRCRGCGAWIGWRYAIVEAAVGTTWAMIAWKSVRDLSLSSMTVIGNIETGIAFAAFLWVLIALAALDAENLWLPDFLTLPTTGAGFLLSLFLGQRGNAYDHFTISWRVVLFKIGGIAGAAALILAIRWVYWLIRRREGLGLGDAKLMALLAAWLDFPGALLAFGIGVVVGAFFALIILLAPRHPLQKERWGGMKVPLGTFLGIGGIISALWGQAIIGAYLRWAGF